MPATKENRRFALPLLLGATLLTIACLGLYALWGSHSRFLAPVSGAEWIIYPVPPRANTTSGRIEQHALFQRVFDLPKAPQSGRLRLCAFRDCSLAINNEPVVLPPADRWNQMRECEIGPHLHLGANEVKATVTNSSGPPALWLCLDGPGFSVGTDGRWTVSQDGSIACAAHLAERPLPLLPGNQALADIDTLGAIKRSLPMVSLFALIAVGLCVLGYRAPGRRIGHLLQHYQLPPIVAGFAVAVLSWILLFNHNTFSVPQARMGFDADYHLKYVQYVIDRQKLPLADEGWEMHQPPLYYVLTAGLLSFFRLSTIDPGALVILRLESIALGITQLALVAACMTMIFPGQTRRQLIGLGMAAFLPVHIYLVHHITNETLLMTLGTAAIYLCLRILRSERPRARQYAVLGLCLGAVLLSKMTGIVVVGVMVLVLAARLFALPAGYRAEAARGLGLACLVMLLTSGWYYARVWNRFGTPLVGSFDPISGYLWWQDPGCGTIRYFTHFGKALSAPFYSSLGSLPDGLYATLWGDGMCGGVAFWKDRPPWNYDLMASGYLLALAPSLMIALGLIVALVLLVKRPRADWFLLLGVAAGLAVATLFQILRYPYSGLAKSIYLQTGMVTLCALGAWGADCLARLGRVASVLVFTSLGLGALTAYFSFWIEPESAATQNWIGNCDVTRNRHLDALERFRRAVQIDPHFNQARLNEAGLLAKSGASARVRKLLDEVLQDDPNNPEGLILMGLLLQAEGQDDQALDFLKKAGQLAPDNPLVQPIIARILMKIGRNPEAILAFRRALRITPESAPADHANLGILLAQTGQIEEAIAEYRQALRILPDYPYWQADLAWLLSTAEDRRFHNPQEALDLARAACAGIGSEDPACLEALAAAQASAGDFAEALKAAQRASGAAAAAKQEKIVRRLESATRQYQKGSEYHTNEPLHEKPYYTLLPPAIAD